MIRIPSDNSNPTMKSRSFDHVSRKGLVFFFCLIVVLSLLISLKLCSHKNKCIIYMINYSYSLNKTATLLIILLPSLSLTSHSIPWTDLDHLETKDILENVVIGLHAKKMQVSDRGKDTCNSTIFTSRYKTYIQVSHLCF